MIKRLIKPLIYAALMTVISLLEASITGLINTPPAINHYIDIVLGILLWVSYAVLFNRLLVVFVWEGIMVKNFGEAVPKLLQEIAAVIIAVITFGFIVAYVFKKSVTGLWATSGVISVVLGFALRGMLADIFAGIAINMEKPFRIGDWIEAQGRRETLNITGKVEGINWRTTRILTTEKNYVIISNSVISMMTITNYSQPSGKSRFSVHVTLDFCISAERAKRLLLSAAKLAVQSKGFSAEPEPEVLINRLDEKGVEYEVRYWIFPWKGISPTEARDQVMYNIIRNLHKAGVDMSYPKRSVSSAEFESRHSQPESREDRMLLLSKVSLFSNLNDKELEKLAEASEPEYRDKGDVIVKKGDTGDSIIILLEGMLEVFDTRSENNRIRMAVLRPGDFFGEMSFFTGSPRSADVRASTEVCLYKIRKNIMDELLKERPEIAEHLSRVIAARTLANTKLADNLSEEKKIAETNRLSRQILASIKSFFKIF